MSRHKVYSSGGRGRRRGGDEQGEFPYQAVTSARLVALGDMRRDVAARREAGYARAVAAPTD